MTNKLSTKPESLPTVNVKNDAEAQRRKKAKEAPQTMIGTLVDYKAQKSGFKNEKTGEDNPYHIYTFKLVETDMSVTIKVAKDEYVDAPVEEGDLVTVFAPTQLHTALRKAEKGMTLKITYLGKGKANAHGGKAHEYEDVEIVEAA